MPRLDLITARDLPVTVGRYTLTGLLGEGGMARVFRAQMEGALGFKKPAAVKVVLPAGGDRGALLRQQLIQEARLGGLLNHPNVVQTFDCGELEGFPYIAMELIEGAGLDDLLEEVGPLSPGPLLDIAIQIARGLHHAHSARHEGEALAIIHRDVKPSNVLVREDGVVKVMDFGIAKVAMQDALSTATGMTKGTPSYMSPEQLAADPLDARTDLFALGALIHYMRTGKTLFVGSSLTEVMLRIIQVDETVRERGILREADEYLPGLGAVMARLLVKDRDQRFNTGAELERELMALRGRLTADHRILASLVAGNFGEQLADARQKASSITGASPFPGLSMPPLPADGAEPGPTRSFPANQAVSHGRAPAGGLQDTQTVGTTSSVHATAGLAPSEAVGWTSGASEGGSRDTPTGTQTRPQFPARTAPLAQRAKIPRPAQPKTVPRPKRRTKKRPTKVPRKRQGALFVLGIVAGGFIAMFVVALLLRGGGETDPIAPEVSEVAPASEVVVTDERVPDGPGEITPAMKKPARKPQTVRPDPTLRTTPTPAPPPKSRPEATPAPPPKSRPEATPAPPPKSRPEATPAPKPDPRPTPMALRLGAEHVPIRRAAVGTTKAVVVNVDGPANTVVILHYGPPGGPFQFTRLDRQGGGVYKGGLSIGQALGGGFEYWILVKNKRTTPRVVTLGRQSNPYVVSVF